MDPKKIKKHIYGGAVVRMGACLEKFLKDKIPGLGSLSYKEKEFASQCLKENRAEIKRLMKQIRDDRNKAAHYEKKNPAHPVFNYEEFQKIREKSVLLDRILMDESGESTGMEEVMLLSADEQIYTMGNAGDFIKHSVLIKTLKWLRAKGKIVRFADSFGGNPYAKLDNDEIRRRLNHSSASHMHPAWDKDNYYGSGHIAKNMHVRVFASDKDMNRRSDLHASGLDLLDKKFPNCDSQNGYCVLNPQFAQHFHAILIDPLGDFLTKNLDELDNVRAAVQNNPRLFVIVFVLDWWRKGQAGDGSGRYKTHCRFMQKRKIFNGAACSLRCPAIEGNYGIKGERKYDVEVLLVGGQIAGGNCAGLRQELSDFADAATEILPLRKGERVEFWGGE